MLSRKKKFGWIVHGKAVLVESLLFYDEIWWA